MGGDPCAQKCSVNSRPTELPWEARSSKARGHPFLPPSQQTQSSLFHYHLHGEMPSPWGDAICPFQAADSPSDVRSEGEESEYWG